MRGPVPIRVLVILGLSIACGLCCAQDLKEQPGAVDSELQTDSPFAEEIKQLESATDKEARQTAFDAVLTKAVELKSEPEPLVSILLNKKPEETFADLLVYVRDTESAQVDAFLSPLILATNDPGDNARVATACVLAYGERAVKPTCDLLQSENAAERLAAAHVCGERVGGTAGVATVIPHLVNAMELDGADLTGTVIKSLKKITLLDFEKPSEWKAWLKGKSERDLIVEIADREAIARRKAEEAKTNAERELLKVLLTRMREEEFDDATALIAKLNESAYLAVRLEAVKLLGALMKQQEPEVAAPTVEAIGVVLTNPAEPEELRKQCAMALADCGKPELSFPHIDKTLAANGISADLKLELVKGLNAPIAAPRVAALLAQEIEVVESRSGAVLETLISQVRSVLEIEDKSESRDQIIGELARLLTLVSGKVREELPAPARKRYVDLAIKTCDTLVHVARLRRVDISGCADALVALADGENGVSTAALTALRQALSVPGARTALLERMTTPPMSDKLRELYERLTDSGDEQRLINVLGLYENMEVAPEPIEMLRQRLIERAESTSAVLPDKPDMRKTLRDALRGLIARLIVEPDQHIALIGDLLDTQYGVNDALGYLQVLPASRVSILTTALQPHVNRIPIELGLMVEKLDQTLTADERGERDYKLFRGGLSTAVRGRFKSIVSGGLKDGVDDKLKQRLTGYAGGALRNEFVPAAVTELRSRPDQSDARDTVAEILLASLRQAHPEKYDEVALDGKSKEEFITEIDSLNALLRNDGYAIP